MTLVVFDVCCRVSCSRRSLCLTVVAGSAVHGARVVVRTDAGAVVGAARGGEAGDGLVFHHLTATHGAPQFSLRV